MSTPTGSPGARAADLREQARLEAVRTLELLDRPAGADIEEAVRLAAEVCGVPNASLNVFDEKWQHPIVASGLTPPRVQREDATCWPVITGGREIIAEDARLDPRLAGAPAVDGRLGHLRFFATVPLITGSGDVVGTLCAYDLEVREVSEAQIRMLRALAAQVISIFQLRKARAQVLEAVQQLAEESERSAEVLETSADAYFAARPDGRVTAWNRAAEELFGYPAAEAVGHDLAGLIVRECDIPSFRSLSLEHARAGTELRKQVRRKDGTERTVDLRLWPTRSQPGWHAFARDVTGLVAAEEERAAIEERWRVAFESAPLGVMVSDVTGADEATVLSVNDKHSRMVGRSVEQLRELGIRGVTHPDDIARDLAGAEALLDGSLDVYRTDKRYLHADGHVVWGRLTASIARTGERAYMISQVEDITGARADERARRQAEALLTIAFDHAPHGTAIIGVRGAERGRLLRVNPALSLMIGRDDLPGDGLDSLLDQGPEAQADQVLADFEELADGRRDGFDRVFRLRAGGGHIFVQATVTLSRDENGRPEHALAQLRDITQQQAHEEWLTRHAKTDPLTGLANRLAMRERLVDEIDGLRAGSGALAVLMLDLDRFKGVNDTLGHEAGDELLLRVAEALVETLPPDALAARLGGDEFVVIAPRTNAPAAAALAERIAIAVNAVGAELAGRVRDCVTGSVGVITTENPATAPEDLVRAADEAMYRAKRNRIDTLAARHDR